MAYIAIDSNCSLILHIFRQVSYFRTRWKTISSSPLSKYVRLLWSGDTVVFENLIIALRVCPPDWSTSSCCYWLGKILRLGISLYLTNLHSFPDPTSIVVWSLFDNASEYKQSHALLFSVVSSVHFVVANKQRARGNKNALPKPCRNPVFFFHDVI